MSVFNIKRIYDEPSKADGYRVLVDRLWPRGVARQRAQIDEWNKDIAPSSELRKWFDHQPDRFAEFKARYEDELADNQTVSKFLTEIKSQKTVTLLYAAKDPAINHAVVLQAFLQASLEKQS